MHFLGHIVSGTGVSPAPEKVMAIAKLAAPTDVHKLRSFLSFCNYYNRFVLHYAQTSAPLTDLLATGVHLHWDHPYHHVFEHMKHALCTALILILPDMCGELVV